MLVAGEASGDVLGGRLAQVLRARLGDDGVRFVGVGGEAMAREGLRSPFDIAETSVAGLIEGLAAYPRIVRRADEVARLAVVEKPDIAILIELVGLHAAGGAAPAAAEPRPAAFEVRRTAGMGHASGPGEDVGQNR